MSKRKRGRGGRPKQAGRDRYQNGRAKPLPAVNPETLMRRAKEAGVSVEDAKDARCGTAIGKLLLRRVIGQREHDAGVIFAKIYTAYAHECGMPDATARAVPLPYCTDYDPPALTGAELDAWRARQGKGEDARWVEAKDNVARSMKALQGLDGWRLVHAAVVEVAVADNIPPLMLDRPMVTDALRRGLRALADLYRVRDTNEDESEHQIAA